MGEAGPEANGFDCGVWNTALVAELIWRRFGVRYHPCYLSGLLKKLGLSYQKARFISDGSDEETYEQAPSGVAGTEVAADCAAGESHADGDCVR